MAGQVFQFADFKPFIRHEIGEMERMAEEHRKLTVLYVRLNESPDRVSEVLKDTLRHADVIFNRGEHFFLALPTTDKEGAMHVARLLEQYFERKVHDVATTWPEDGMDEAAITGSLIEYVQSLHGIDLTAVIG
jgi:hypothetical protein